MMKMQKNTISTDKQDRRRGRPAGKNRKPLSLEERRARNALYERERRNETVDAMTQLAQAACCDPEISNAELLATVISQLQRRAKRKVSQDIEDLNRTNETLEYQISKLQSRLGQNCDVDDIAEDFVDCNPDELGDDSEVNSQAEETQAQSENSNKQARSTNSKVRRPIKIRKTSLTSSKRVPSESEPDSSDSEWSGSVNTGPIQYQLRNQKLSEQSGATTSTYLYGTESESSQYDTMPPNELHSEDSNQSEASDPMAPNSDAMTAISKPNMGNAEHDDQMESALLESFTDREKQIINEWLVCSEETLNTRTDDHVDNRARKFLEFDNFLLDIDS